jgi:voltage-gated potassium channel
MEIGATILVAVLVVATAGYMIIEQAPLIDAVYMAVITLSTVGFREVIPLSTAGRLFTMIIIISGVGTLAVTGAAILEAAVENLSVRQRRRMQHRVNHVSDHAIVCGWGRVGSSVWEILQSRDMASVVVEQDPVVAEAAREAGALVIEGDATHDETLAEAGVKRANAVVACVNSDSDNLVIALSAKDLNPNVRVVARASDVEAEHKLAKAGADRVVAPQVVGARRIAALVTQPELADVIDLMVHGAPVEFRVQRFTVEEGCEVAGKTLRDAGIRQKSGALVLALEDRNGEQLFFNPSPNVVLEPGMVVVAVGSPEQLELLDEIVGT